MRQINARHKRFLDMIPVHGWYQALKRIGYSQRQAYRILKLNTAIEYLMSNLKEMHNEIGLNYRDRVKKLAELADNPDISDKIRFEANKYLVELCREANQDKDTDDLQLPAATKRLMLQPAQVPLKIDAEVE